MPKKDVRRKLRRATILYWTLLIYIVAALVWWFITLEKQNDMMKDLRVSQLRTIADSTTVPALYAAELQKIKREHRKNDAKTTIRDGRRLR